MSSKTLAVKRFKTHYAGRKWQNELDSLRLLDHPNVIKVVGQCRSGEFHAIVFPYVATGNLRDHLGDDRNRRRAPQLKPLSMGRRIKIATTIAKAVSYIHQRSIIHGDIKSENILIDKNLNPILCDFEMSLHYNPNHPLIVPPLEIGTEGYRERGHPPNEGIDVSFDVYSFGVLLMEITSGFFATGASGFLVDRVVDRLHIAEAIDGRQTRLVQEEAAELFLICQDCTRGVRDERPSMEVVVNRLETIYKKYHK